MSGFNAYNIQDLFEMRNRFWDRAPCPFDLMVEAGMTKRGCEGDSCPCGGKREGDMTNDYQAAQDEWLASFKSGSKIAVEVDGVVHTQTVTGVTYQSPEAEVIRRMSRWERFVRRLTPKWWRRTLLVRPYQPHTFTLHTDQPMWASARARAQVEKINGALDELLSKPNVDDV